MNRARISRETLGRPPHPRLSRQPSHQRDKSKADEQNDASRGDEFGCAPAQQFDGAARSLLKAARYGFGIRSGRPGLLRLSRSPKWADYRQVFETTNEFVRIKFEEDSDGWQTATDVTRARSAR